MVGLVSQRFHLISVLVEHKRTHTTLKRVEDIDPSGVANLSLAGCSTPYDGSDYKQINIKY